MTMTNKKTKKIGVSVITKDRPDFFIRCISNLPPADYTSFVNDGTPYDDNVYKNSSNSNYEVIQHPHNLGIACAKNSALRSLIQNDCDFLFLVEDDVIVKNKDVFMKYIRAAEVSGLWHMNFGYFNEHDDYSKVFRSTLDYDENNSVIFTYNIYGGFEFFHKSVINAVGYMDERYSKLKNMEHVDHSYRIVKLGLLPAYYWWPDINNSWEYLETIRESANRSQSKSENFQRDFNLACNLFKYKHGYYPVQVPDTPEEIVLERLEKIQKNYSRRFFE